LQDDGAEGVDPEGVCFVAPTQSGLMFPDMELQVDFLPLLCELQVLADLRQLGSVPLAEAGAKARSHIRILPAAIESLA